MKNLILLIATTILILFLNACRNDDAADLSSSLDSYDCTFEQADADMQGLIDESERSIMDDCVENAFESVDDIEANLIGNWELAGFGHGWFANTSNPCAYIQIGQDELTFKFESAWLDTLVALDWNIQEIVWPSNPPRRSFLLETDHVQGLSIEIFCEDYMFVDHTPTDGNMYLYQKVQ